MTDKPKDTIVTITISPIANGKRKVLVSGAPEQEMPIVRTGTFQDLHRLIDDIWIELQKRKPQLVKVKAEKPASMKPASVAAGESKSDPVVDQDAEQVQDTPDGPVSADEAMTAAPPEQTPTEEQIPLIEGDTTNG